MTEEELPLCECGCGLRVTKLGNRYIWGHNRRWVSHTPETIVKMSAAKLGIPHTTPAQLAADDVKSERQRGISFSPERCDAISSGLLGVPKSPEHCAAISESKLGVPHTTPAQLAADEAKRGIPHTTPAQLAWDERRRGLPLTPGHIAAIKKGVEDSGVIKSMCGGNDIIEHHYIYDHSDLSKYTMKMTRSAHTRLHNLMRKAGIKVPHINDLLKPLRFYNQKVYKE